MSDSSKMVGGHAASKAEVVYEIAEMLSLDNVYLAAKAREKTKRERINMSEMQEIKIPELDITVYAKKDKDPKAIKKKYLDHAKEMHQRMNPVTLVVPKEQTKTKSNAKTRNAPEAQE